MFRKLLAVLAVLFALGVLVGFSGQTDAGGYGVTANVAHGHHNHFGGNNFFFRRNFFPFAYNYQTPVVVANAAGYGGCGVSPAFTGYAGGYGDCGVSPAFTGYAGGYGGCGVTPAFTGYGGGYGVSPLFFNRGFFNRGFGFRHH